MSTRRLIDDVEVFFEQGLYIPTRTVYMGEVLDGGTDHVMAERVIKRLHVLDAKQDAPIAILMNNPGGDEYHGLAIYDAILGCKNHVTITAYGHAMSMGSIILQAADERIMSPNARMLIHHGTWAPPEDHPKTVLSWAEEGQRFSKWMIDMYLAKIREKHPRYRRDTLDRLLDFDALLTAQETVDLGLADRLV